MSFARNQRRIRRAVAPPKYETVIEADRRFFARRPHRRFRVRYAARAELDAKASLIGLNRIEAPPGQRWFTLIKKLENGHLIDIHAHNDADAPTDDLSESAAREAFELVAGMYLAAGYDLADLEQEGGQR